MAPKREALFCWQKSEAPVGPKWFFYLVRKRDKYPEFCSSTSNSR